MLTASQFNSGIEPHPYSVDDFYSGNPFAAEIKRTGLELLADVLGYDDKRQATSYELRAIQTTSNNIKQHQTPRLFEMIEIFRNIQLMNDERQTTNN